MKFIERLKAIKAILFAEKFFVAVANQNNPYGRKCDGPIIYKYFSNTDISIFLITIKEKIINILSNRYKRYL